MAAPLFTQSEIAELLKMRKVANDEQWQAVIRMRAPLTVDEINEGVPLTCDRDDIEFHLAFVFCRPERRFSCTLKAKVAPRGMVAICRYEIQIGPHENPDWFEPKRIEVGQPHRHIYNERAVREKMIDSWEDCAEPVDIGGGGGFDAMTKRLQAKIADELNISVEGPDANQLIFGQWR